MLGYESRRLEDVAGLEVLVLAAHPLKALFLFFQLGHGELAVADLLVYLGIELAAVGQELRSLLGPVGPRRLDRQAAEEFLDGAPAGVMWIDGRGRAWARARFS